MAMKEGDIYLIRDRDLRVTPPVQSTYLKIGIAKDTPKRVKQHQTGNPHKIETTYQQLVPGKTELETFLHHYFSTDRIRGEWFWIDSAREASDVMPVLTAHHNEQKDHQVNLVTIDALKKTPDNGNVRVPTSTELTLSNDLKAAEELLAEAKAQHDIHDYNLRAMLNSGNGIDGVITLNRKASKPDFDNASFLASLTPAEHALCHSSGTQFESSPKFLHTKRTLPKINPTLSASKKAAKALAPGPIPLTDLANPVVSRTSSIESEHHEWLSTRRDIVIHKWTVDQKKAELMASIGDDKEITGVLSWIRVAAVPFSNKWSSADAKKHLAAKYNACCTAKPDIVEVTIHKGKPYP
ncbi:GIY-YIG nuclease family protein [Poseidonia sp.]|uniref:GIY-YIG nuclease family protein n=1 Tax=Poseidonia sp. TaxID=2666344 RepID=UPI003F69C41F